MLYKTKKSSGVTINTNTKCVFNLVVVVETTCQHAELTPGDSSAVLLYYYSLLRHYTSFIFYIFPQQTDSPCHLSSHLVFKIINFQRAIFSDMYTLYSTYNVIMWIFEAYYFRKGGGSIDTFMSRRDPLCTLQFQLDF